MEQNKLTLIETNYDLNAQVINLARMMESRAQEGVELHVSLPEHPVIILADQSRLAQVIMNFLSNAFKFTAKGHVTIHVNALHNGDLELSVSDTGSGIDEGDINKLFTQFSQVTGDSAKNIEGTGLGLAICKSIIEQMGGQIDVSSMIDQGSCFSIYLPNRIQHHSQETLIQEDNYELNLEDISILIVDDIAMNCIVLEGMLEEFGANKVSTVNSGEHAIAFIKEHAETAIVLMDVRMPIMTGMEATVLIREMGFEGIIIAVTANASVEDESDCLASGMNYFLAKPIELDKLKHLLNQALT